MNPAEFRRLGHLLIDTIADYREGLEARPVMSRVAPGEIKARLPPSPPSHGGGLEAVLRSLEQTVLPGITHWNHPSFFAYFPSNTSLASVLADLVCAGLGAQGMSWQTSPAATEIEEVMVDWLRQLIGLPEAFSGVIHDTASTATLCALICARERTTEHGQVRQGLQGAGPSLVVYASDQAHSSVEKAALLAGFGRAHLRLVESDGEHAMAPGALEAAVQADLAAGRVPCAVVATTGTTATTACDPIDAVAQVAARHRMWLHVDAALAGSAMALPEKRALWAGVERADSIVWNPHKWLGPGFDCSVYHVRDAEHLVRVMSTNPSYLRTAHDGEVRNLRDWGIPLGRRFRALKVWFTLVDEGTEALRARLRRDLDNARWLAERVDEAEGFERVAPVPLQTVCFRHAPAGLPDGEIDRHNLAIARAINESGRAYVTPSMLKGRQMIRVSVGALTTERLHLEALWREVQAAAQR